MYSPVLLLAAALAGGAHEPVNPEFVARLVAALDADDFKTRDAATKALLGLDHDEVVPHLKAALASTRSAEQAQRCRQLLDHFLARRRRDAVETFDRLVPGAEVPYLSSAWYVIAGDARDAVLAACRVDEGVYNRLYRYFDECGRPDDDDKRSYPAWRNAARNWGIDLLRAGVPAEAVRLIMAEMRRRDLIWDQRRDRWMPGAVER